MKVKPRFIGYLKYKGKSVNDGLLDARKSGEALIGFDKILRHFLLKENPLLTEIDFEIPVEIKKGSWMSGIPENIGEIILLIMGLRYSDAYLKSFFQKAGKDGLFETGIAKDINKSFQKAVLTICWIIEICKHTGTYKIENSTTSVLKAGQFVKLINDEGRILIVPKEIYKHYLQCPQNILSQNVDIINEGETMEFSVFDGSNKTTASVSNKEKWLFINPKENFLAEIHPELKDGAIKTLEGKITRVNEDNNSIGFYWKDINIECKPEKGAHIALFKSSIISKKTGNIFQNVKIKGIIDRIDDNGNPKRISMRIITIKIGKNQGRLFSDKR